MPFPFVRTSSALLAFPLILAACGSDGGPVGENANATPASGDPTVAALAPGEAQPVQFEASDGVTVHGAWYPAKEPAATILLFHQAGANKAEYATIAPMLAKAGYNALAIDQRSGGDMFGGTNETVAGIGGSAPDYEAALADMDAALAWARTKGEPVIVWGSSYSAALAFLLAAQHPGEIAALLTFSPGEYLKDKQAVRQAASKVSIPIFTMAADGKEANAAMAILSAVPRETNEPVVPQHGAHGSSTLIAAENPKGAEANRAGVMAFLKQVTQ